MLEAKGNIFDQLGKCEALLITTNGFVKKNGDAVMGRGCAKEASIKWTNFPRLLGQKIQRYGNIPNYLATFELTDIWSFPVKPVEGICAHSKANVVRHMKSQFESGDVVPGWALIAELGLIKKSAEEIARHADMLNWKKVVMPRPGCGAGELDWGKVQPVLAKILDDRFTVYTF